MKISLATVKTTGQNFTPKGSFLTPLAESTMHRLKKGSFDPGALVMNLTQILVENDCIWGQSDYSRSHMNDSFFFGQKMTVLSGSKQGNDPDTGLKMKIQESELENEPKM